ncbi:MAG: DoxX family membrane protein [Saprospiraceae bacterium]|nr:DoxX family membrane protein [Saprospiraceae bacterium]
MNQKRLSNLLFGGVDINNTWLNFSLLALRLYVGITMMSVGLDKMPLPDWMTEQVASIGFPAPTFFAWLACFSEFGFGALLALGILTRPAAFFIGFTMAMASFLFQKVLPFVDMHIAQHYVWSALLFMAVGGGKYAIDHVIRDRASQGNKRIYLVGLFSLASVLAISLYYEMTPSSQEAVEEDVFKIESVNVAGNFNNWDPASNEMIALGDSVYQIQLDFDKASAIAFKFTANKSWDYNIGILNQNSKGFPLGATAVLDEDNNTQNIVSYIPDSGQYSLRLDLNTFEFNLE